MTEHLFKHLLEDNLGWFKEKLPLPEKLNICVISKSFLTSGPVVGRSYFWPIAKTLAQKGHNVTILSDHSPQQDFEEVHSGVRILYLSRGQRRPRKGRFERQLFEKFHELHKSQKFHLVHGLDTSAFAIGQKKKELGISMAYDAECTQISQIFSLLGMAQDSLPAMLYTGIAVGYKFVHTYLTLDRKLLSTADGMFVTTPRQQIVLDRYYLYPELKTYQVPYGLEPIEAESPESSTEFRKTLGFSESARIVVTLSDMTEKFDLIHILRAFQKVAIKKPSSRLIIIGQGPYFKEVEYEMLSLALGSKVRLVGAVKNSDVPKYIGVSNVFVNLSSRSTGLDPSLLTAMAQRKIIIGSEVSAISTVVEDSADGFLIRPADYQELASLLINIFSDQIPTREMGDRARQKVFHLFDLEKMVRQTENAYLNILKQSGHYTQKSHIQKS